MSWLIDTNVVSEWRLSLRDPGVIAWLDAADPFDLHLSVVTLAELRFGVELQPAGRKKRELSHWIETTLRDWFEGRILPVDQDIAEIWAVFAARSRTSGVNLDSMDLLIAATAQRHGLTVVTRNVKHFAPLGVPVLNPWSGG